MGRLVLMSFFNDMVQNSQLNLVVYFKSWLDFLGPFQIIKFSLLSKLSI